MKCQKCHAENINEAVKCGVCGARLKHTQTQDNHTGNRSVQASIQRDKNIRQSRQSHRVGSKQLDVTHTYESPETDKSSETKSEQKDKARILLNSIQEKFLKIQGKNIEKPLKNKKVVFFIVYLVIILGIPIIGQISNVIIPEISYQIREHLGGSLDSDQNAVPIEKAEDEVATDAAEDSQYQQRYQDLVKAKSFTEAYYEDKHKFPRNFEEILDRNENVTSIVDPNIVHVLKSGGFVGIFADEPSQKIYMLAHVENDQTLSWECYLVDIPDEALAECTHLASDPYIR